MMIADDECSSGSVEQVVGNGTFVAFCSDCELNSTDTSENISSFSECEDYCLLADTCYSFEYNHVTRVCLLNLDKAGNVNVLPLARNSSVEVWMLVSNETAARYADTLEPLGYEERIRPELVTT
jgi:hypothetical protein